MKRDLAIRNVRLSDPAYRLLLRLARSERRTLAGTVHVALEAYAVIVKPVRS